MNAANASLLDIIAHLRSELARGATSIELDVLDPDAGAGHYAGERIDDAIHRPFRTWVDLAERLRLRLRTPRTSGDRLVRLTFEPLDLDAELNTLGDDPTERYGTRSEFARISKLEDPGFVLDLADALARVAPRAGARVLDLGVNTGDEIALALALAPSLRDATVVGIDHSASAIAHARDRYPTMQFHVADLSTLGSLGLGRFDLVISIGTLQSPGIDDREIIAFIAAVPPSIRPRGNTISRPSSPV